MAGQITLLRLQRAWTMSTYTQGAAALYPGLCASALTARAGQCIFCEQVVRVNQEQVPFLVMKAPFMQSFALASCKALRWRLQSFALAVAKLCVDGCNALRWRMQCFASEMGNPCTIIDSPILDK